MALLDTPGFTSYCVKFNTFKVIHQDDRFPVTIFISGLEFEDNNTDIGLCDLTNLSLIEEHPENLHEDPTELY